MTEIGIKSLSNVDTSYALSGSTSHSSSAKADKKTVSNKTNEDDLVELSAEEKSDFKKLLEELKQVLHIGKYKTSSNGSYSQYNAQKGKSLAQAAASLYGNVSKGGGLCATGVSQAISKALGYTTRGNGCDYGAVLSQRSDWVEITDKIKTVNDLKNLPAGAIVSWSAYNTSSLGRLYGHVYICDGQGHGISDFKENISSYYWDRGSKCRVFIPA